MQESLRVLARDLWMTLEPVHAVTYFAPECRAVPREVGLKGFWMGYFASRAAPMGRVGPAVVEASFYNFHPDMVRRAIPAAWEVVDPSTIIAARSRAAATALRRQAPAIDEVAPVAARTLDGIVERADSCGLPLFAANKLLPPPDDPVEHLWQATTSLREHRGDGHVLALVLAGLDGCEAHLMAAASTGIGLERLRAARGWSEGEWGDAADRLMSRGLLGDLGAITPAGEALHRSVEDLTDDLAARPLGRVHISGFTDVLEALEPVARAIRGSGEMPFPNPIGVPAPRQP